jgi:hypothetical protein
MDVYRALRWKQVQSPMDKFHSWLAEGLGVSQYAIGYDFGCSQKCPEYGKFVASWKRTERSDPNYIGIYDTLIEAMVETDLWHLRHFGASATIIPSPSSSRSSHLPPGSLGSR